MSKNNGISGLVSDKLDKNNFHAWKFRMTNFLMGKGYLDYIDGNQEEMSELPDDTMIGHIQDATSPKQAWDRLVSIDTTNTKARKIQLKNELNTVKKENLSINDYTLKIKGIVESLASIGVQVEDDDKVDVNETSELVPLPEGKKFIGCKWVYKVKHNADGSISRYKARLVTKGYAQTYGIDYEETFSLVAKMATVRTVIAVVASKDQNVKLRADEGQVLEDVTMYRQIVGSLIYLTISRPDLSYSVGLDSQFMQLPRKPHLDVVRCTLRYVSATLDYALFYDVSTKLQLSGFTHADWAGSVCDRRSTNGFMFSLGSAAITWSSKKQPTIALSSTEAEYRGAEVAACEVAWLELLLGDLGIQV
ncbi:hypothetical protein L7F22_046579 [Adiantum nelumboides]|nr:hypothetical protein [Adiantum nelumboides]